MNWRAKELGLTQTYFLNESGLDEGAFATGGYGSARDTALLLARLFNTAPGVFGATRSSAVVVEEKTGNHRVRNTNTAAELIPGLIGGKTGLTDLAGGNLAVLIDAGPNHPVAIVVLGSTEHKRFTDVGALAWETLRHLNQRQSP
jgi:D-alanyl-D-alanine carboxypeptidase (penicillin-binding protein 5/6)